MSYEVKVTSKGQITLPAKLRQKLEIEPGDHLEFVEDAEGTFHLRKKTNSFSALRGMVALDAPISSDDLDRMIRAARTAIGTGS